MGPFRVLERVGRLAYRLEFPPTMSRLHPVISIAHLEPATDPTKDPFERPRPQLDHPLPVTVDGEEEFEIEKLLRKRQVRRGRSNQTEYLVKWVGWGPEYNVWYNVRDLDNAADSIRKFKEEHGAQEEDLLP